MKVTGTISPTMHHGQSILMILPSGLRERKEERNAMTVLAVFRQFLSFSLLDGRLPQTIHENKQQDMLARNPVVRQCDIVSGARGHTLNLRKEELDYSLLILIE
jgi:hypothetical protein